MVAGELSSDDDFYLLDTGLAVLQTTDAVFNASLYSLLTPQVRRGDLLAWLHCVHSCDGKRTAAQWLTVCFVLLAIPQSVLSWQRARIACFTARDGKAWTDVIGQHNSGTGNNQWMVVDLKRFQPGRELSRGLLWVVEQMPGGRSPLHICNFCLLACPQRAMCRQCAGMVVASDQTDTLLRGYWPSYNIPYHPEVYQRSGYPEFLAQQDARGPEYGAAAGGLLASVCPR